MKRQQKNIMDLEEKQSFKIFQITIYVRIKNGNGQDTLAELMTDRQPKKPRGHPGIVGVR